MVLFLRWVLEMGGGYMGVLHNIWVHTGPGPRMWASKNHGVIFTYAVRLSKQTPWTKTPHRNK